MRQRRGDAAEGADDADEPPLSFADEIRQRRATHRILTQDGGGGVPFLFNKLDFALLLLLLVGIWFVVKMQHKIDLAAELWEHIRPNYDRDHWTYYGKQ